MIERIVSGGQTGADRAALDFALECGLAHGGWCPLGRLAEDGTIDARYRLTQTPSPAYVQRTEWNVRDSDATAIFSVGPELFGGSLLTVEFARRYGKPWLHLSQRVEGETAVERLAEFLRQHRVRILNVAGPRESSEPSVGEFTRTVLRAWLDLFTTRGTCRLFRRRRYLD